MKKIWKAPIIQSLEISQTMNDLTPKDNEDHLSWTHGFPAYLCS